MPKDKRGEAWIGGALLGLLGGWLWHWRYRLKVDDSLAQLTQAVKQLGQGDLDTPIPPQPEPAEALARTLEESRLSLQRTMTELVQARTRAENTAQSLVQSQKKAGQHLQSYFLANISHEFRTPLSALNASIELLLDESGHLSLEEMGELLNSIHLSASGLQTLVDNLLESAHIEAGHFTIHRRPTELNRVIAEAIQVMQPLLDRRQQALSLSEPLLLPTVQGDPARLTQVMINLLSNASKYSPLQSTIDLCLEARDSAVRVAIADQGPGIPAEERAALFDRFVRIGAQDKEQYGIGLGLSVVKAVVQGHGGDVGIDERPGGGSVFWFTLPVE